MINLTDPRRSLKSAFCIMYTFIVSWHRVGNVEINQVAFSNEEVALEFFNKVVAHYNVEGSHYEPFSGATSYSATITNGHDKWHVVMREMFEFENLDAALDTVAF